MIGRIAIPTAGNQERVAHLDVERLDPGLTGPSTSIDELHNGGLLLARHHVPQGDEVAVEVEAQRIEIPVESLDPVSSDTSEITGLPVGNVDSASRPRPGAHQHFETNLKRRAGSGRGIPNVSPLVAVLRADVITATVRVLVAIQQCLRDTDPHRRRFSVSDKLESPTELVGPRDCPPGIRQNIAPINPLPGNLRSRRLNHRVAGRTHDETEKDRPMKTAASRDNRPDDRVVHRYSRLGFWHKQQAPAT